MPRGRNNRDIVVLVDPVCSEYLSEPFFKMAKETNQEIDCPVCLSSVLKCSDCFLLLKCGHALHSKCYYRMEEPKCPLCRDC